MKYMKRAGIYQASNYNCTFNPKTMEAFSYRWWKFIAVVEGKVVFNSYRYSNSTSKHQSKVRGVLNNLGIKIDLELPLPKGINSTNLAELILIGEETLCDKFLSEQLKAQDRYQRAKVKRLKAKLTDYLETQVNFRDYDITDRVYFGNPGYTISTKVAVHQVVEASSLEHDVENALHSFHRDGFGSVVFYV